MMTRHPLYKENIKSWQKFRATYAGGKDFVERYVIQRPREDDEEFDIRLRLSHCPAHAKSVLNEVKNSIFTRLSQGVSRVDGSDSYNKAIKGQEGGVDRKHSTMTRFIGSSLLPELLSIGKVGVWVDSKDNKPFFTVYHAENILSWVEDVENPGHFERILLRNSSFNSDEHGFPDGVVETFRIIVKMEGGVKITEVDDDNNILKEAFLEVDSIPFAIAELSESLLTDVADFQISLANLDSSDISYCWFSNIPIYTEQTATNDIFGNIQDEPVPTDTDKDQIIPTLHQSLVVDKKGRQRTLGATEGIAYHKGTDRPGFISPPSDPLMISMKKQETMRDDIRTLINLSLKTLTSSSAESKQMDSRGLEAGLSAIGLELQALENRLAELWAMFEQSSRAIINYPDEYELKNDEARLEYAEGLIKMKENFPSPMAKIAFLNQAAEVLFAGKIGVDKITQIIDEIATSNGCTGNPDAISKDLESGLVSVKTASALRGYAPEEHKQAQKDKAKRIAMSINAQRGSEDFKDAKLRGESNDADSDL